MRRFLNRQVLLTLLMVLLVATAGCTGQNGNATTEADDGGDDGDDGEDGDDGDDGDDGADGADGDDAQTTDDGGGMEDGSDSQMTDEGGMEDGSDGPDMSEIEPYQFSQGESYTYTISSDAQTGQGGQGGQTQDISITWEVTSVSAGQVTVDVTNNFGQQSQSSTIEASQGEVVQQAAEDQTAPFFAALRAVNAVTAGRDLSMGNTWTVQAEDVPTSNIQWNSAEFEVVGTDSYQGLDCTNVEFTPDTQSTSSTACVNPDYPFALSVTSEAGGTETTIELTDASR